MRSFTKLWKKNVLVYIHANYCVIQMTSIQKIQNKCLFIFDLEFNGNIQDLPTCRIWEIAVWCKDTHQMFEAVIDPDPEQLVFAKPPIPEIPQLTRQFLVNENAQTFDAVLKKLVEWVRKQTQAIPIFISHNTHKADKPILELEAARYQTHLPLNWFFFDSLHFCRDYYKIDDGNFSVSGLNLHLFNCAIVSAHRARYDVEACTAILGKITCENWQLVGPVYSAYNTSLRTIRWIGQKAEQYLIERNICSVEILLNICKQNATADYLNHNMDSSASIYKTICVLLHPKLPKENIVKISNIISTRAFTPYITRCK
jgi:DNA polymerase III epsilon subunit-like protein